MKIIGIKKDKRHLIRICFDSFDDVLLDSDTVLEHSLYVGADLNTAEIEKLCEDSEYRRTKSRALWYLDRMDYSEKGLFLKLYSASFSKKTSAKVLENLVNLGLVDDTRYATRLVEKLLEQNKSKREILNKLFEKGISADLAKLVLSEQEDDEEIRIKNLLERKYAYKLTLENGAQKVFSSLIRKGFSFSAVKSAMKDYLDETSFYN